ncbi:hypothetical protein [Sphingobacterium sp. LRF_L2]|uniref:hypothetical protein n=1 Tax=Sphingobacterium sp. LRF_L2 TaxID=3369421 RepID=UPI003F60E00D
MRKYVLTSQMFAGSVTFGYNENGRLVWLDDDADFNDMQRDWLLSESRFPKYIDMVDALANVIKGKLTEVPYDISFDAFWDAYANKKNRKRAEGLYNKMSEQQRLKCILSISPYLNYLSRVKWRNQSDPDTYLRNEQYETDWNKQFK